LEPPSAEEERQQRVEQLLRDAHLQRMRQQWAAAEALCRQALELNSEETLAQEMLADLVADRGEVDEAIALYRRALEKQPQKAVLEEKIARLALRKGEAELERLGALMALEGPKRPNERKRSAIIAVLLSLVCPGAGQYFLGQRGKGILLFGVGTLALVVGIPDLFTMVLGLANLLPRYARPPNDFLAWIGIMGAAVWLYSLLDASAQAGKIEKGG
jgi:tetratricopeptide (TPR) repeat protein